MDEKIKQLAKDLKLIKELQASDIYTANYQEAKSLFSLGYRKESDTAREILTELKPIIINYLEEYMENGSEEAPKYFESLCKKYGVDLGE